MTRFPIILSAPSGAGKTTIAKRLLAARPDIGYSVSCTTRPPRPGEADGRDYYFLDDAAFLAARERGEFAESAGVHGRLYGTLRREVSSILGQGRYVLMDIDPQGARQFHRAFPESVLVFVLPPDAPTMLARLLGRNTEDAAAVQRRLRSAVAELRALDEYEYVVVNDDLARAVASVSAIVDAEALRRSRRPELMGLAERIASELETELTS